MSVHDHLMRQGGVGALLSAHKGQAVYHPPGGLSAFAWDVRIGEEKGGVEIGEDGYTVKVMRLTVQGPTAQLVAKGVTELQYAARVDAAGHEGWSIDLAESSWGASLVKLGLKRRPIVRQEQMESALI